MKWIAAVLTSLIYVAGYLHGIQYSVHAAALGIFCVTVLGVLFNRLQEGPLLQVIESANAYPLELGALTDQLGANGLMPLYILTDAGGTSFAAWSWWWVLLSPIPVVSLITGKLGL
jgi:hypothetical protein